MSIDRAHQFCISQLAFAGRIISSLERAFSFSLVDGVLIIIIVIIIMVMIIIMVLPRPNRRQFISAGEAKKERERY